MIEGLQRAELSPWRMELVHTPSGAVVINDAYNANPMSMAAALRSLAQVDAQHRVAVLGTMAELGPDADRHHAEAAELAAELGVTVLAVDEPAYGARHAVDQDEAFEHLAELLAEGVAVLVKGSRVAGLERLAARLADHGSIGR